MAKPRKTRKVLSAPELLHRQKMKAIRTVGSPERREVMLGVYKLVAWMEADMRSDLLVPHKWVDDRALQLTMLHERCEITLDRLGKASKTARLLDEVRAQLPE